MPTDEFSYMWLTDGVLPIWSANNPRPTPLLFFFLPLFFKQNGLDKDEKPLLLNTIYFPLLSLKLDWPQVQSAFTASQVAARGRPLLSLSMQQIGSLMG